MTRENLIRCQLLVDFNQFARPMRLQYIFHGEENEPHPFHVKSDWEPPVQPSVALETFLEEVKLQLASIYRIHKCSRAERPEFECLKARLGRPQFTDHKTKNMTSSSRDSDETAHVILTEDDIPGASLAGRNPSSLKNEELKFWLRCRGDSLKGLKRKAQLIKQ